jgi:NAD+ kinase
VLPSVLANAPPRPNPIDGLRLPHAHTATEALEQASFSTSTEANDWQELQRPLLPASYRNIYLRWSRSVRHVLIVYSIYSESSRDAALEICRWLREEHPELILYSESEPPLPETQPCSCEQQAHLIDLVICLGGDGLILHICASLFPEAAPPLMPFHLGTLGFLTPFPFKRFQSSIKEALYGAETTVTLRMRLDCAVFRDGDTQRPLIRKTVLNEVVVDRGPAPFLSNLECYCDDFPVTRIQADGVILATPTGSTAYSLSSSGSMVHPSVPAILLTPICPHSLSFRPVIFPDYVTLKISVPRYARGSAWVSFDGRSRTELRRGDYLRVQISPWPLATLNYNDQTRDWFRSVSRCLRWNERPMQRVLTSSMDPESESSLGPISPQGLEVSSPSLQMGFPVPPLATPVGSPSDDCCSPELAEPEREASALSRVVNAFRSPPEFVSSRMAEWEADEHQRSDQDA